MGGRSTGREAPASLHGQLYIGCATDKRFVEPTAVMLNSVETNGGVPDASIVVTCFGLDDEDRRKLAIGAGTMAGRLRFFDITQDVLPEVDLARFTEEYPPAVLGKLLIAEHLGEMDGRLLTLDSDMIVNASLRPLFELDLGGEFFAAIHDPPKLDDPNYFNSGLTLSDLKTYRHHDIGRRCLRYIVEHKPHFPDQDALNNVVGESWYRLDASWNSFYSGSRQFMLEDYEAAKVAHFCGWKPWDYPNHPARPLYERYLARYRFKLHGPIGIGDPPLPREFIASSYEVLLGRELETIAVLRDRGSWRKEEVLRSIMSSEEFTFRVLPTIHDQDKPFPDGRFHLGPTLRQRLWAADVLGVDDRSRQDIERSGTWRELLNAVLPHYTHLLRPT